MRTIKFRAWHKINKIMYWWDIIWGNHARGDGYIGMAPWGEDRHTPGSYRGNMVLIDPDNCQIMQFTGLHDKNGREIYEGDILRVPPANDWEKINYNCFEVFFHDGNANSDYNIGYSMDRMHCHGSVCGGYVPRFKPKQVSIMEIIGNLFENPELL